MSIFYFNFYYLVNEKWKIINICRNIKISKIVIIIWNIATNSLSIIL